MTALRKTAPSWRWWVLWLPDPGGCRKAVQRRQSPRCPRARISRSSRPLRQDLEAVRHPSDGGGREPGSSMRVLRQPGLAMVWQPRAMDPSSYEAGPLGIAEGGWLFLPGATVLGLEHPTGDEPRRDWASVGSSTSAEGCCARLRRPWIRVSWNRVQGRALEKGRAGAGRLRRWRSGAVADRYAESESSLLCRGRWRWRWGAKAGARTAEVSEGWLGRRLNWSRSCLPRPGQGSRSHHGGDSRRHRKRRAWNVDGEISAAS